MRRAAASVPAPGTARGRERRFAGHTRGLQAVGHASKKETRHEIARIARGRCAAACRLRPSQPEPLSISDVTVEADLAAVGAARRSAYWKHLSDDLETAIAGQFVGRIDPAGQAGSTSTSTSSRSTSPFASGATAETARLSGRVTLSIRTAPTPPSYDVTATAQDVATYLPPGTNIVTVPPTSAEYYQRHRPGLRARGRDDAAQADDAGS